MGPRSSSPRYRRAHRTTSRLRPVGGATTTISSPAVVSTVDQPTLAAKIKEVRVATTQIVGTEKPAMSVTRPPSTPVYSRAGMTSCGAPTTITHSTTTTPTSSVFVPVTPTFGRGRRRSSSEGVGQEKSRTGPDIEELSRVKLLVAAKTQKISQESGHTGEPGSIGSLDQRFQWIEEELRQIRGTGWIVWKTWRAPPGSRLP